MHFIVYNINGKILRTGSCQDRMLKKQARPGETVIEGKADDTKQKIVGGKVVAKTQSEIDADNPSIVPIPEEDRPTVISKKDWQNIKNDVAELKKQIQENKK